jgi:hypothetical protein
VDILLAADTQHIIGTFARSARNRSGREVTRLAAVALRMVSGTTRTTSGVKRLKRCGDAEPTGDAAGDAKRSVVKRF